MKSNFFKKTILLLAIVILISAFISCDYNTPTQIYTDDDNGMVEFENEFEIQLVSIDFAEDSSWLEYHFVFELKKEYSKKILITIDNFKLREGNQYFQLSEALSSGYISSYSQITTIKLDGVEQDEIYQYMDMGVMYTLDIKLDFVLLQTSCEILESKCENISSNENGILLSFDGNSIWFGDLNHLR